MEKEKTQEQLVQAESDPKNEIVCIDTQALTKESTEIINQVIHENDVEKVKDLTYLFNINHNKKTMLRQDKLNELQDIITDQLITRFTTKPDEMSNQELMNGLKTVQDVLERSTKQINGVNEQTPLITINQQHNEVNVGEKSIDSLNRDSREKVKTAVLKLLNGLSTISAESPDLTNTIEAEVTETDTTSIAPREEEKDDGKC